MKKINEYGFTLEILIFRIAGIILSIFCALVIFFGISMHNGVSWGGRVAAVPVLILGTIWIVGPSCIVKTRAMVAACLCIHGIVLAEFFYVTVLEPLMHEHFMWSDVFNWRFTIDLGFLICGTIRFGCIRLLGCPPGADPRVSGIRD
jgi:hypothetical protein